MRKGESYREASFSVTLSYQVFIFNFFCLTSFTNVQAGIRNLFGGRVKGYEDEIIQARAEALKELEARASAMGANAVIGVRIDFDALGGDGNNMLLVTATGTAVVVR